MEWTPLVDGAEIANGRYLVTIDWNDQRFVVPVIRKNEEWYFERGMMMLETVVASMPMPLPYTQEAQ